MGIKIAFLRGINVGGNKKVPMADLKKCMEKAGYKRILTLLNTGNVIFDSGSNKGTESELADLLKSTFGFDVPVLIRESDDIKSLIKEDPFEGIEVTKDIRLYITFLKNKTDVELNLPWSTDDGAYRILQIKNQIIVSVLDLAGSKTVKAMDALEKMFGKDVTTRNWNTVVKIAGKL